MFKLVFGKGPQSRNHTVLSQGSLEHCASARAMSGDLVLDPDGKVNQSDTWLWPWEKEDPNCYARKMQRGSWTH